MKTPEEHLRDCQELFALVVGKRFKLTSTPNPEHNKEVHEVIGTSNFGVFFNRFKDDEKLSFAGFKVIRLVE